MAVPAFGVTVPETARVSPAGRVIERVSVALPAPSATVTFSAVTRVASPSSMVASTEAVPRVTSSGRVWLGARASLKPRVSSGSSAVSSAMAKLTVAVELPAERVTVLAVLSVMSAAAALPSAAVAKVGVTVSARSAGRVLAVVDPPSGVWPRLTVSEKLPPSATLAVPMASASVALSSSVMVTVAAGPAAIGAPSVGALTAISALKLSSPSITSSWAIGMATVVVLAPEAMVKLRAPAV